MDKQKAAKQLISQVIGFLEDNEYLDYRLVQISKAAVKRESEILDDDLEQLQDIAYYQLSVSCARAIQEARKQDAQ
jgi:hypothetical protein